MAEAELRGAESELAGARDSAVRDVWKAYTDFKTALRKQDSAAKLVTASQNAFDAVLESYKNGLGTYPEIVSAQRNLSSARSVSHDTQSAIFTSAGRARLEHRRPGAALGPTAATWGRQIIGTMKAAVAKIIAGGLVLLVLFSARRAW